MRQMKTKLTEFGRRDFLRLSALGAGSIVAAKALPAFADDPSVFPQRGGAERLVLAYQHIHLGLCIFGCELGKIQVDSGKVAWMEAGCGHEKAPCRWICKGL